MRSPPEDSGVVLETVREVDGLILVLGESLRAPDVAAIWPRLHSLSGTTDPGRVVLDLSRTTRFDTSGAVLISALRQHCAARQQTCELRNAPRGFEALLCAVSDVGGGANESPRASACRSLPSMLGDSVLRVLSGGREGVVYIGDFSVGLAQALRHPRRVRWRNALLYFEQCGVDALPIVALICLLMGIIMAFQAAVQLHAFGADIYVADLVGLSITRELGPLMVAIICAGRSGAAFAAEIGTMRVSEEIDALVTMGLDANRFLLIPKVLGLLAAVPCLTLLGDVIGVAGGAIIGVTVLDLPFTVYFQQTVSTVTYTDVVGGLAKSVVFALLVAGVGCFYGFRAGSSAQSVGRAATSAVVAGIFLIVLADAGFSIAFHVLGV